jgi:hypothetical protein
VNSEGINIEAEVNLGGKRRNEIYIYIHIYIYVAGIGVEPGHGQFIHVCTGRGVPQRHREQSS